MCVFRSVRHISARSGCDWCCMRFEWASLNCVCLSVTANGSHRLREPQLRVLGVASPHMHTHFIYSAHRWFVHFCNLHPHTKHCTPHYSCVVLTQSSLLCFPKTIQSKPLNPLPSPLVVCCFAAQPPSPSLSAPFSPENHLY